VRGRSTRMRRRAWPASTGRHSRSGLPDQQAIQAEALVVHVFIAADRDHGIEDQQYVLALWQALTRSPFNMTEALGPQGVPIEPRIQHFIDRSQQSHLLAARRTGNPDPNSPYPQEALLRREKDVYCVSVMRELHPSEGKGWIELDEEWSAATATIPVPAGLLGVARVFLGRLATPGALDPGEALTDLVRFRRAQAPRAESLGLGVSAGPNLAIWEEDATSDELIERRIIVIGPQNQDAVLSAWAWVAGQQELPRFARYLMHAAKLRYEWSVWSRDKKFQRSWRDADAIVDRLLRLVTPTLKENERKRHTPGPSHTQLLQASEEVVSLQAGEMGLARTASRLRAMRRTVQIATANFIAQSGNNQLNGLFAADRALAEWLGQQLDDDLTYLDAARESASQVAGLTDQLIQRSYHRRQERFNLGLTGIVGAILMGLAAIQSLQYTVPIPPLVKPALVTTLGLVALMVSLIVLRYAAPERRWARVLVQVGFGLTIAALIWTLTSLVAMNPQLTRWWSTAGFLIGFASAAAAPILHDRSPR